MAGKTHLIIPDSHAHPHHHNRRADWVGELIADVRPDVVVHIGDSADMPSLASYDKGKKSFQGRTYRADINAHTDFQERLWHRVRRRKKSLPRSVFCIGNHEQRIARAIEYQPELEGAIGYHDLELSKWYDEVVHYEGGTPGTITIDGVTYAHYFVSGVMGRAIGGEHPAHSLVRQQLGTCVAGHLHTSNWVNRQGVSGNRVHGLLVGCYIDYRPDWAGKIYDLWWRGAVVLRNVENGDFDPQFISVDALKKEYA